MLDTLITSKTRIKLLLRFFLNSSSKSYLRNLETEFNESTNSIRLELNRFEKAGLLVSGKEQNRKVFKANTSHPLFPDINNIVRKYVGFDQIIEKVLGNLGSVKRAFITGDLAMGKDADQIDLFLIGTEIDLEYLERLISKTKALIHRDIHYKLLDESEEAEFLAKNPEAFLIWKGNGDS
ncbi:MAG: ArsR family transcriptional regulator [Bacteroidetes bacterium]|nr:ArsR family transcriptional regulator [Bacteroidota bacterium]